MLIRLYKSILIAMLLMVCCGSFAHAESKLYQYDGKLPFVKMMLNMMVAMGILDRLPANGAYGRYGTSGFGNPYARALAMRGISPGMLTSAYGKNPLSNSPWLQTPWSSSDLSGAGVNPLSPVWGSPSWGVLPTDSYSSNYYPAYESRPWTSADLDGWVNETWETSEWNPDAGDEKSRQQRTVSQATVQTTVPATVPLVQNFNYTVPASNQLAPAKQGQAYRSPVQRAPQQQRRKSSPLNRLLQPGQAASRQAPQQSSQRPPQRSQMQSSRAANSQNRKTSPQTSPLAKKVRPGIRQKPCVTDFCGLKKPNLNGLWVAQDGEMLGIKNQRYLWSDSSSRYLTGQLLIQNEYLLTNIDGHDKTMRFKYKLAGNHLLTMQPDGTIREFVRTPMNQYNAQSFSNNQRYSNRR